MKTSIQFIFCALALIIPLSTTAADKNGSKKSTRFGTGIYSTKKGKINVYIDKAGTDFSTTILLKNETGDVIYREIVDKKNQKFGRQLNVDALAPGTYEIKVIVKDVMQTSLFKLTEQKRERSVTIE
ncbi:hypothetical protein SAMN04487995_5101 [Dyadobacter koreensis]|uniref:Por secretion system C-terminal sorting domain-containing protein n=1 Tax=Dyadobacter koreensis TaxID=408657 RepID=A0A1H6ZN18_9BACT|nr:hypothetical protein [Dyadobacter koreensis]SEJ50990.1 hypothetical protein SAMN04487995_5101 [Dyadobacter koreensis]